MVNVKPWFHSGLSVPDEVALAEKRLNAQVLGYQAMASARTASLDECDAVGSLLTL